MIVLRLQPLSLRQPLAAQNFWVTLSGAEVRRIRPETDVRALPDPEQHSVDPIALLAVGAGYGLFSNDGGTAVAVHASAERLADARIGIARWRLLLDGVDSGALRLLVNMLAYGGFDSAEIIADGYSAGGAATQANALPYPSCTRPREFDFAYNRPMKSRCERTVRLRLLHEPDDATLDLVIAALDAWSNIIMAGAYATVSTPGAAGAFATPAILDEPCVVGISLPICFGMDEIMFSPIINLARRTHALHAAVRQLEIS